MDIFIELLRPFIDNATLMFIAGFLLGVGVGANIGVKLFCKDAPMHEKTFECVLDTKKNEYLKVNIGICGGKLKYVVCPLFEKGKCTKDNKRCSMYNIIA